MKKNALLCVILFWHLFSYGQTISWEQLSGPYGGEVQILGSNTEGYLFAVLNDNVLFRSNNDGQNWEKVSNHPAVGSGDIIIGLDGKLYVLRLFAIHVSEDNGDTWTVVNNQVIGLQEMIALPSGILIGYTFQSFLRSEDGGLTWETISSDVESGWVASDFRYDPYSGDIFAFEVHEHFIYQSTDEGLTWSRIFDQAVDRIFDVAGGPDGGVWIAADANIWYSFDSGENWTVFPVYFSEEDIDVTQITILPNGRVWVLENNITFYTEDNGENWQGGFGATYIFSLSDESFWVSRGHLGLFKVLGDNLVLEFLGGGMNRASIYDLVINSQGDAFAITVGGVFRSTDDFITWELIHDEIFLLQNGGFDLALNHLGHLFATYYGKVYRSIDNGETFLDITPGPANELNPYTFLIHPEGDIFLSSFNGLYFSSDNGENWEVVLDEFIYQKMKFHPNGNVYVQLGSELLFSTDIGQTWESLPYDGISTFEITEDGIIYVGENDGEVSWTSDEGLSWDSSNLPNNFWNVNQMSINVAGHVFVGNALNDEIYRSVDQGLSWSLIPSASSENSSGYLKLIIPSDQHLYISNENIGLYRTSLPTTEVTYLKGNLKQVDPNDCISESNDPFLSAWLIQAEGPADQYSITNTEGTFLMLARPGTYYFKPIAPSPYWEACSQEFIINPIDLQQDTIGPVDLAAKTLVLCPYLEVDISINFLRRCFTNSYFIRYCNNGTTIAENAAMEVDLDSFMEFEDASIPISSQTGNQYIFDLGNLAPGDCGTFQISFTLSCEAELGTVHCVEARMYPNELCLPDVDSTMVANECQVNVGAFDPNDKRVFVNGYPQSNYVQPGEMLEYQIRFQNTGTDTAFNIVILDTLAKELEVTTIRPGASSHPYKLDILGDDILQFTFENIMLPDSNINEVASHGFVNFQITPKEGLQFGTSIENTAAIYFDFNEPIFTNTVQLILDEVSAPPPDPGNQKQLVKVYPNPFSLQTTFDVQTAEYQNFKLEIFDTKGQKILEQQYQQNPFRLNNKAWPPGLYWYRVLSESQILGTGKLVVKGY